MNKYDRDGFITAIVGVVLMVSLLGGIFIYTGNQEAKLRHQQTTRCQELAETYGYTWKYDSTHTCLFETRPDVWLPIDTQ